MSSGAGGTVVLVVDVVLDVVDVLVVVLDVLDVVLDVVELDVVELVLDVVLDVVEVVGVGCTTHPDATKAVAMTSPLMYEPLRRGPRDRAR